MNNVKTEYNMLNLAVEMNDVEGVRSLLLKYPSHVNLPLEDGRTPLYTAIIRNNISMMRLLIEHKANVNRDPSRKSGTRSPLWVAMLLRLHHASELLIQSGADVNERFGTNWSRTWEHYDYDAQTTFLHVTVHRLDASLARVLMQYGADLSARNSRNRTALYDALVADCPSDLILEMLDRGARHELTHIDPMNRTYLHPVIYAANEQLAELLLAQPEIDATLKLHVSEKTTLHFAAEARWESANIAKWLLQKGVEINAVDKIYGNSALHLALRTGKSAMARLLINKGADINAKNNEGIFPLYLATERCSLDIMELLIFRGANLHQQTPIGQTALHIACNKGFQEKIKSLLISGLDPLIKDEIGRTAFQMLKTERTGAARQMIERLAIVKIAEKRQIDDKDWNIITSNPDMHKHFKDCTWELERMKSFKMYNNVTLFHILAMSDEKLGMLIRNDEFLPSFELLFFEYKFPVYKDYFIPKLKRGEKKKEILCQVENHLRMAFSNHLTDGTLSTLTSYVDIDDLPDCGL